MVIFAFFILGEALTGYEILGVVLLIIGTFILSLKKKEKISEPFREIVKAKGNYYIIAALILFTISSVLDKALLSTFKVPLNAFMGFQHLFFAIIFFATAGFSSKN